MPSPSSCTRCSKPLALASPSGLCPECAATSDTADLTPVTFFRGEPASAGSTATVRPPTAQSTATADPAGATGTGTAAGQGPLPNAPAGYELLDRLGSGGMGAVYLAREQAAERLVAMKFLHQSGGPDALDRFLVELRVLARLDHPNIVRVLASDFLRADPFFTMEYMSGGSLSRALDTDTPVPVAEAVRLVRTVAGAITAAHAQGVIHRDLKPANILLTPDGIPKVSDFGLAKRLDNNDLLTVTDAALGTPSYMPPEQISKKNGEIGPWSDVYGLGATLYHLLAGRAPFNGDSSEEVIAQVLVDPPARLRAIRADVSAALEGIVLKCLEKDPKDRYQTVAELAADLDRFTAGQRPVAPPLTRWRRAKRWVRRNRRGVTACAGVVVLLAGAFALGAVYWHNPPAPETPADPLKEMQDKLAAGRPMTLIRETGLPAYSRSVFEPTQLGESPLGDGTCSFHAFRYAAVELCTDPMTEHYRVTLELRRLGRKDPQGVETDWFGFYFGYGSRPTTDPARGHLMFAVKLKDYPPPVVPGQPQEAAAVYFQTLDFVQSPDKFLEPEPNKLCALQIIPSSGVGKAGNWRPLSVEISPTRLFVQWRSDDGTSWLPLVDWTREKINNTYERRKTNMDKKSPGARNLPQWEPRMPFGLVTFKSAVSVRNVVVTPLP